MANTITRNQVRQIREHLEAALNELASEFELHSQVGTIRFSGNNISCRIDLSAMNDNTGVVQGPEADQFLAKAYGYGMNPKDLGRWFTSNCGRRLQIVGLKPRATRYPIICQAEDGSRFKFASTSVRCYLDTESQV